MRVLSVVGARPQFVKAAVLIDAFEHYSQSTGEQVHHLLLHTGQHYDARMSDLFFEQLQIPAPDISLGIGSGSHGVQTAAMLQGIEAALVEHRPDVVIVYGDTNSTLAAALAAVKMHIAVVHIEAGLRSFNRAMPEEINRVVSDHISSLLLCPTGTAMENLEREGVKNCVLVGDVMLDAVLRYSDHASIASCLEGSGLSSKEYALVTLHRAENTDDPVRLGNLMTVLEELPVPALLPLHPRLKKLLGEEGNRRLAKLNHVHVTEPAGYFEMLSIEKHAKMVLTDSGGVQKEAYFVGVPCLTLRDETEWIETLQGNWNRVVGTDPRAVLPLVAGLAEGNGVFPSEPRDLDKFGGGRAGIRSVEAIVKNARSN